MSEEEKNFGQENPPASDKAQGEKFVDIHCHCLPGIDDGPATMAESLSLCRLLVRDRIGAVVATPHQLGRFDNDNKKVKEKVSELNKELRNNEIPLRVFSGGDVRIDERIVELIKEEKVMTAADGGKYLLLELPENVLINIDPLTDELLRGGIKVIISHPERQHFLSMQPQILLNWAKKGCGIQITAGSLLGRFGTISQKAAWQLLSMPLPLIVATDAHSISGRSPCMRAAFEMIYRQRGEEIARLVCIENPTRVIKGQELQNIQGVKTELGENEGIRNKFRRPAGAG